MNRIDPAAGKNMDLVFLPSFGRDYNKKEEKKKKGGVVIRLKYTINRSRSMTWQRT